MGQQEVYDFLMKNPDSWYTSKQISEKLAVSIGSVTMSLKKLRKTNIIKFRNTGKRNTFQYMVQSEPAKLAERKIPMMEQMHAEPQKVKVKIKPKIVHQHTYLGGQTFYGVIRPAEEVAAMERRSEPTVTSFADEDEPEAAPARKPARTVRKVKAVRKAKKKVAKRVVRRVTKSRSKAKPKKVVRKASHKTAKAKKRVLRKR